jgi:hypothetical protein
MSPDQVPLEMKTITGRSYDGIAARLDTDPDRVGGLADCIGGTVRTSATFLGPGIEGPLSEH